MDDVNFIAGVMDQLYANRENHQDHKLRGVGYMILVLFEQGGHLADAIRERNWKRAEREIFHVSAILYELYERIAVKVDEQSGISGSDSGSGECEDRDAAGGSVSGDGVEPGADSGAGEVGEAAGEWEGAGATDND